MGAGQVVHAACGLLRQLVHRPAAGVGEPQHPRRLVEAFASGIVTGGTQHGHIGVVRHIHDQRIAAGDGQRHEGRLQLRKGQIVGGDVSPHMVHRNQGHTQRVGGGFGKADAHQHRADEPRCVGDGHGIDVLFGQSGVGQRLVRQGSDGLYVLAGGDLRHHAAIEGVHIRLGQYGVGQQRPPVPDHGHRCLVAGGLES